jgi:hypothetical protein
MIYNTIEHSFIVFSTFCFKSTLIQIMFYSISLKYEGLQDDFIFAPSFFVWFVNINSNK